MANLNKVFLIGRLTRDPEVRTFSSGGKVANFGFAVNNRRKNPETSQWEDEPVFIDVTAWSRAEGGGRQLADLVEQYLRKGQQAFLEGHLQLDQWTGPDGQKRSKLKIVLDNLQFLEPRADAGTGDAGMRTARQQSSRGSSSPSRGPGSLEEGSTGESIEPTDSREEDIPF
jgi:single-strand DNA-binding protein